MSIHIKLIYKLTEHVPVVTISYDINKMWQDIVILAHNFWSDLKEAVNQYIMLANLIYFVDYQCIFACYLTYFID